MRKSESERRALWHVKCAYAAAENALAKMQRGELERAYSELTRLQGIAYRAQMEIRAALDSAFMGVADE